MPPAGIMIGGGQEGPGRGLGEVPGAEEIQILEARPYQVRDKTRDFE